MGVATIHDSFAAFVEQPTRDHFRRLQRRVLASPHYDAWGLQHSEMARCFQAEGFQDLLVHARLAPQIWKLSPRYHYLTGIAAHHVGDHETSRSCRRRMQAVLRGLVATGDGSPRKPFRVTFLTDEADLLRVVGGDLRCQQLVRTGRRCCDVLVCHDGSEVWCDVTRLLATRSGQQAASSLRSAPSC
jgi:hypothetical protein